MKSFKKLLFATLFGFAAIVAFSACHRDEKDEPVTPPAPDSEINTPLCFTAMADNSSVSMHRNGTYAFPKLEYSYDGVNWQPFVYSESTDGLSPVSLAKAGDKIYVRNQGKTKTFSMSGSSYFYFRMSGKIAASGNIMSLLNKDDFSTMTEIPHSNAFAGLFIKNASLVSAPLLPATKLTDDCYNCMFSGCTNLAEAPELPATEMKSGCYLAMFRDCRNLTKAPELKHITKTALQCFDKMFESCTSLTEAPDMPDALMENYCCREMFINCNNIITAPALPSTDLDTGCYAGMFGGCIKLNKAPELPATNVAIGCYEFMFDGCINLTSAPELPAKTMAKLCYYGMFNQCRSLVTAPELPATELAKKCYTGMFIGCSSLTTAPELPATTLAEGCYWGMFTDCSSITKAPQLPATTLANKCYDWMFNGCTNLDYIEVAFDQWAMPTDSATFEWVGNVAAEGTFVCPDNLADVRGISNIPEGWTKTDTPANQSSTQRKAAAKASTTGSKNIKKAEIIRREALKEMPSEGQCVLTE